MLGASKFPKAPLLGSNVSLASSAEDMRDYFLDESGLAIDPDNVKWLFDDHRSPLAQLEDLATFLSERQEFLRDAGTPVSALIFYYVGHGIFTRGDQAYCFAIRTTNGEMEGPSSIRAVDLAKTIKNKAFSLRRYLILDCCFAATAYKDLLSAPLDMVSTQIYKSFPRQGTSLLCASSAHNAALAPPSLERTMFTDALLRVLRSGHPNITGKLSFSDIGELVTQELINSYPSDYVRPEVHSPDQQEGNIADIPLFPNPAASKPSEPQGVNRANKVEIKHGDERQAVEGSTYTDPITGMEFVFVKGGCYQMGDTFGDGDDDERPVHEVCVNDFWIGKYEVTQGQWMKVMGNNNPSSSKKVDNYPVETVNWDDVQEFITKLNRQTDEKYRLPTEAEWEYAAREGGKQVRFATGTDRINSGIANFDASTEYKESYSDAGKYRKETTPVGSFMPNGLGIYDMSGNVWEWVEDIYSADAYRNHKRDNPIYTGNDSIRVLRGGSWSDRPRGVRVFSRRARVRRSPYVGFRLARTP
ncbi:MAG: SUMF1/EgtB/PvdO family nonheme iron enzyme [Nitrospirae bacterium]|nr:SUMF1/EgtB/PvdO family nonheme iron enzyme [Nitrospirota bacterium]